MKTMLILTANKKKIRLCKKKKFMKKCNSTDIGDLMVYCKNTCSQKYKETWESIFRNTPNLTNIITATASDVNMETKVTPV